MPSVVIQLGLVRAAEAIIDKNTLYLRRLQAHSAKPFIRQRVAVRLDELPVGVGPQVEQLAELPRGAEARYGVYGILFQGALAPRLGDETLERERVLVLLAQDRVGVIVDRGVGEDHDGELGKVLVDVHTGRCTADGEHGVCIMS